MNLEQTISNYLTQNTSDKIAVAVSGGVDSMVICSVLYALKIPFIGLHCNFKLRAEASDGDQNFVEKWFAQRNIPLQVKEFDTKALIGKGETTQITARRLRYEWFKEYISNGYSIALGHHLNDRMESFWINLYRGTGLLGLDGMPQKANSIIRPMLTIPKSEVLAYANQFQVNYRDDESNDSDAYLRNAIRHHFVPVIEDEVDHESWNTFFEDQVKIKCWIKNVVKTYSKYIKEELNVIKVDLKIFKTPDWLIYNLLRPYGMKRKHFELLNTIQTAEVGKRFDFEEYQWINERDGVHIVLKKWLSETIAPVKISLPEGKTKIGNQLIKWESIPVEDVKEFEVGKLYLAFPNDVGEIVIRSFKEGDRFIPLGMKGEKKLSSIFSDDKEPTYLSPKQLLLELNGKPIAWLLKRISEDVKIKGDTKKVVVFSVE